MNITTKKYIFSAILILLSFTLFATPPFWEHEGEMGTETAIIRDIKLLEGPSFTNGFLYSIIPTYAYRRLVRHGKKAIPYLIANAYNPKHFDCYEHFYSPSSDKMFGNIGFISLYLIEAILHDNETPHWSVDIKYPNKTFTGIAYDSGEVRTNIVKVYEKWWEENKDKSLDEIRKTAINPLASSKWYWSGYLQALDSIKLSYPTNWRASVRWRGNSLGCTGLWPIE